MTLPPGAYNNGIMDFAVWFEFSGLIIFTVLIILVFFFVVYLLRWLK